MANQWLRLWHDMPNDPKWRTIARVSKQSVGNVLGVYVHLLVNASNATERGRTQNVYAEDIASALDTDVEQIEAILDAMQGRVLSGDLMTGWDKRQPAREDGAAERAKAWREQKKTGKDVEKTQANASERNRTLDKDKDKDKDKGTAPVRRFDPVEEMALRGVQPQTAEDWLTLRKAKKAPVTATVLAQMIAEADKAGMSLERAMAFSCQRGWTGFKASWVKDDSAAADQPAKKDWI